MFISRRPSLLRTLKTELPPPEVIQDLRTVCHEAMLSAPAEELSHSGSLQIRGLKERRKWSGGGASILHIKSNTHINLQKW